jgi:hypothetical protein
MSMGVFLLLTAAFFESLFVNSIGYACAPNEYTQAKECASHHLGPFVLVWIGLAIEHHNGVVTAIATIVMAFFAARSGS